MEQWEKNFYISSVAGANSGSSLVVMSKGMHIFLWCIYSSVSAFSLAVTYVVVQIVSMFLVVSLVVLQTSLRGKPGERNRCFQNLTGIPTAGSVYLLKYQEHPPSIRIACIGVCDLFSVYQTATANLWWGPPSWSFCCFLYYIIHTVQRPSWCCNMCYVTIGRHTIHAAVVQSERFLPVQMDKQEMEGRFLRDVDGDIRQPMGHRHVTQRWVHRPGQMLLTSTMLLWKDDSDFIPKHLNWAKHELLTCRVALFVTLGWHTGGGAGLFVPERGRPQAMGQRVPDHGDGGHDGPVGPDPEHAEAPP